jgi:hypothetical protein
MNNKTYFEFIFNSLLHRPQMYAISSIDRLDFFWTGFHVGLHGINLYMFNSNIFCQWLYFKLGKLRYNGFYLNVFIESGINIFKEDFETNIYANLLKEFMSIKPSRVYKGRDNFIFIIYYNSVLPWRVVHVENDVLFEDIICTYSFKKDVVKEEYLKLKYLNECKNVIKNKFKKDFKTDFEPYDLEKFMEEIYYKDLKKPSDEIGD